MTCTKVVHVYTVQVITIQNIVQTFVNTCDHIRERQDTKFQIDVHSKVSHLL